MIKKINKFLVAQIVIQFVLLSHSAYSATFMDMKSAIGELQEVVEKVSPGIVMVVVYDRAGDEVARGSGFFIDNNGQIMTNAILLKDAYSAEVFSESDYYEKVTILNQDGDTDLALIQVSAHEERPLALDLEYQIEQDQRVLSVAKSDAAERTLSEGFISSVSVTGDGTQIMQVQTTAPLLNLPPSEDGPLFNLSGEVVGLISREISQLLYRNSLPWISDDESIYAVSVNSINTFLSKAKRIEELHHPKSRVWLEWFLKRLNSIIIAGFIVLYETGFTKIMTLIVLIVLALSFTYWVLQWFQMRVRKK